MSNSISITKIIKSKVETLDFDNIALGRTFTDHMFVCDYKDGQWSNPRITPMEMIPMHPACMALHYGQALFEGMKATIDSNGSPLLFRPEKNAERLNFSARRLGMPEFSETLFVDALKQLVSLDQQWIPPQEGSALYLRPFMFADEAFIGMRAANSYKFIVMASPSKPIYTDRVRLYAETSFIRAAHGGTGEAKAAGNYAAAVLPTEIAKSKGFDQVLWLDAKEFKYIQEVGTMNIFFKIKGQFVTPSLDGSILAGITRMSVIDFLRHKGFEVVERPITIDEIVEASKNGQLEEAFGTGTAVGIAMIQEIGYKDALIQVSDTSPVGQLVLDTINGVRIGKIADELNWMVKVES
jgi:branched-chain amino acid aminotransferase|tara:strand:- start:118 stop:1176 length:1059 start_codon:yes stop_codon:yes gene_type:complete